jgi:hypothetical protein
MRPKNEKRPLTLSSLGTPEQPSPRTAQAQDTAAQWRCIFHLRASAWHNAATLPLPRPPLLQKKAGCGVVEHFLPELVYCESLTQRLYTSMQLFALWNCNPVLEIQRKLLLFNHIRLVLLWKETCNYEVGSIRWI